MDEADIITLMILLKEVKLVEIDHRLSFEKSPAYKVIYESS
jgi:hypothetical protein